jgi:MFS family permease
MTQSIESQAVTVARHDLPVLAILGTLLAFASISTDLYLPAMPAMGLALHASSGAFADGTPWPMGWVMALSGLGCVLCAWLVVPDTAATSVTTGR